MAIDTGTSLDSGASDITYTGDEGPRSPEQQLMASADPMLVEEYQKYVFEMEEQGQTPISFKQFVQQIMSESRMAGGGIARLGYKRGRVVEPGGYQGNPHRDGPPGDASGGGGEGGWDDRVSSAAEDFHSTDTAADFADLGSGGGGQDHDWSNDIGTVGTVGLSPVTTGGISDIDPRFINNLKYASAIKKPFLQTQPWYNKPLNFQTAPKYNIRSYSLGSLDPAGEKGLVGLYDELRDKNLTIGDALGLMETGKYDVLGDKITTDLREHLLENIDFGDTFKEGAGLTNPFGLGTVDPTFKGNILNIDPSKLQDDEARKYLEVAQGGIARLGYDRGGRIGFEEGGWDDRVSSAAEDFHSTDTAADFADLGGGGGGQDHPWEDDISFQKQKSVSQEVGDKITNLVYDLPFIGPISLRQNIAARNEFLRGLTSKQKLGLIEQGWEFDEEEGWIGPPVESGEALRDLKEVGYVPGVELWGPEGKYTAQAAGGAGEGLGGIPKNISPLAQGTVDATGTTVTSPWSTDPVQLADASTGVHIPGAANFYSNLDPSVFDPATEIYTAAHGGRVPAAYGGIMDSATGRRRYGLGSIFKKAKKAIKKITKSPFGKAALLYAMGTGIGSFMPGGSGTGLGRFAPSNLGALLMRSKAPKSWDVAKQGLFKDAPWYKKINPWTAIGGLSLVGGATAEEEDDDDYLKWHEKEKAKYLAQMGGPWPTDPVQFTAQGGRIGYAGGLNARMAALNQLYGINDDEDEVQYAQEGGLMDMGGMEKDYRQEGGFVPIGGQEKADDVPARLSKNEFVFTADAVRAAGGGDIDAGAEVMENVMENLERGGQVSEESQGLEGARDMFATAKRLEGVL